MITLYDFRFSGNGWKVRRTLRLLGIPHRRVEVQLLAGETRSAAFRAKNPAGEIPVLELEDGTCLAESSAILQYLAEGTPWFPREPVARAQVVRWLCFEQTHIDGVISRARFRRAHPGLLPTSPEAFEAWEAEGTRALKLLDRELSTRDWLANDQPSIADIAMSAYVQVADQANLPLAPYPHLRAWLGRVRQLPGHLDLDADPGETWLPDPAVFRGPILVAMAGLPGSGKTTLSQELARRRGWAHLRIDTVEQGLRDLCGLDVEGEGYGLVERIARDLLLLGQNVIVDACNPIQLTRDAWRRVAAEAGGRCVDVEVVCSDADEHRARVEGRASTVPGLVLPTWAQVQAREVHPWREPRIVIDTAGLSVEAAMDRLERALRNDVGR